MKTRRSPEQIRAKLTNAFSKKVANHEAMAALHFAHCNFCRPHQTLKGKTPAMVAGVADHVWAVDELVGLLEAREAAIIGTDGNKPGPYRKAQDSG